MKTYDIKEMADQLNTTYNALRMWIQHRKRLGKLDVSKYRSRVGQKFVYSDDFFKYLKINYVYSTANIPVATTEDRYPIYIELADSVTKGIDKAVLADEILPTIVKNRLKITRKMILDEL